MGDWADFYGVPWHWPNNFPINTVLPLRLALAVDATQIAPLSLALFRAYWRQGCNISDPDVVRDVARSVGIDDAPLDRAISKDPALKQALIDATDAAQAAGVFGAPTFVVRQHLFWGQDRLPMVERALAGWDPRAV
jgi:2-hydroxychromene-2-carboxylate isomerase